VSNRCDADSDLRLLREAVRAVIARRATGYAADDAAAAGIDEQLWTVLEANELTLVGVPETAGGSGGTFAQAVEVVVAAAAAAAFVPVGETLVAALALERAGMVVPSGALSVVAGAHLLRAHIDDGTVAVQGTLKRVPYGRSAAHIVTLAADIDGEFLVLLPRTATTLARAGVNLAGEPRDTLDVSTELPADAILQVAPGSITYVRTMLDLVRTITLSAAATQALEATVTYVGQREQFGRPLAKLQAVQQALAIMAGEVELMQRVAAVCVAAVDAGSAAWADIEFAVAAAKAQASTAAGAVASTAHQLHGAMGTTREHPLRLSTTRLWSWRDEGTSAGTLFAEIGRRAIAAGRGGLWPLLAGGDVTMSASKERSG
jgi:acyl-CoA dehydrogenase